MVQQILDRTDQRFGRLVAVEIAGRDKQGRAMWLCICDCGIQKIIASRHLGSGRTRSCGCLMKETSPEAGRRGAAKHSGERSHLYREVVGYFGLHSRIRAARGPARNHDCVDCGKRARHWSYDLSDPTPVITDKLTFSLDVTRYEPRCVKCHSLHDKLSRGEKTN